MKIKNDIIAALDIGSGKVCCMIASKNTEDFCEVIGIGHNESKGINSGVVTDFVLAKNSIANSINSAEKQAGIKLKNGLTVSLSSSKIKTKSFKIKEY